MLVNLWDGLVPQSSPCECSSLFVICKGPHPDAGSLVFYIIQAFCEDGQLKVVALYPFEIDSSSQAHVDFEALFFALRAFCKFMACSGLAYTQSGQHFHTCMATPL